MPDVSFWDSLADAADHAVEEPLDDVDLPDMVGGLPTRLVLRAALVLLAAGRLGRAHAIRTLNNDATHPWQSIVRAEFADAPEDTKLEAAIGELFNRLVSDRPGADTLGRYLLRTILLALDLIRAIPSDEWVADDEQVERYTGVTVGDPYPVRCVMYEDEESWRHQFIRAISEAFAPRRVDVEWSSDPGEVPVASWLTNRIWELGPDMPDGQVAPETVAQALIKVADVIIVDLRFGGAPSSEDQRERGFVVLDFVQRVGALQRTFVATGYAGVPRVANDLRKYVSDGAACFEKSENGLEHLCNKIYSQVHFQRNGFHVSSRTREEIYPVELAVMGDIIEPVLLLGETGTGKEFVAQHLHHVGQRLRRRRSDRDALAIRARAIVDASVGMPRRPTPRPRQDAVPLQVVHCGALESKLARVELFGCVAGSFTDSHAHLSGAFLNSIGVPPAKPAKKNEEQTPQAFMAWLTEGSEAKFEPASRENRTAWDLRVREDAPIGTVFLDEFGDLPLETQSLLLRFLQEYEIQPLMYGARISMIDRRGRSHIRLIVATSDERVRSLVGETREHAEQNRVSRSDSSSRFRRDLVHRVARWVIQLPPVSAGDLEGLVDAECRTRRREFGGIQWDPAATTTLREHITKHGFPGNHRQVRGVVMRALTFARDAAAYGTLPELSARQRVTKEIATRAISPITVISAGSQPSSLRDQAIRVFQQLGLIGEDFKAESVWDTVVKCLDSHPEKVLRGYYSLMRLKLPDGQWPTLDDIDAAIGGPDGGGVRAVLKRKCAASGPQVIREFYSGGNIEWNGWAKVCRALQTADGSG